MKGLGEKELPTVNPKHFYQTLFIYERGAIGLVSSTSIKKLHQKIDIHAYSDIGNAPRSKYPKNVQIFCSGNIERPSFHKMGNTLF